MISILLAILKCIGILLLCMLLFLLTVVAVVMLSPLRYRLAGEMQEKPEDIQGEFALKWLFGLVGVSGSFVYGQEPRLAIRVLWIRLGERKKKKKKKRRRKQATPKPSTTETPQEVYSIETPEEAPEEKAPAEEAVQQEKPPVVVLEEKREESRPRVRRVKLAEVEEKPILPEEPTGETFFTGETEEAKEAEAASDEKNGGVAQIRKYWKKFQEVENKRGIFEALKKLLKRLIRGILPNQLRLRGTVGLGDPALMGYFMGLMGILTAGFGQNVQIKADFTQMIARDIQIEVTERIIMGYFVYSVVAFIAAKPVRSILIKLWKGRKANG